MSERYSVSAGLWNNPSVWSASSGGTPGATVPGPYDVAIFDESSASCTIDIDVDVLGIRLLNGYPSTLQQGSFEIYVGEEGCEFSGGVFQGGSADITSAGPVYIGDSSFISTSTVLETKGSLAYDGSAFDHNSGKIRLNLANDSSFVGGGINLWNFEIKSDCTDEDSTDFRKTCLIEEDSYVNNLLELGNTNLSDNSGAIYVLGDMSCTSDLGEVSLIHDASVIALGGEDQRLFFETGGVLPTFIVDKNSDSTIKAHGRGPIAINGSLLVNEDGVFDTNRLGLDVGNV